MQSVIEKIQAQYKKPHVTDVRPGDTVKVHQRIQEGSKERVQVFQGLVIRVTRKQSHTSRITVRRVSGGVGVEKSFLLHSPLLEKVEVTKRSKVRRNYLSYMRNRTGKSARLSGVDFDRDAVNTEPEAPVAETEGEASASETETETVKTKNEKVSDSSTDKAS